MTREEAAQMIKNDMRLHHDYLSGNYRKALNMAISALTEKPEIGVWKELKNAGLTPGGTPVYVCSKCGGSEHLHGVEFPKRKLICDECGSVNYYPWERIYDNQ